ncbi:PDZ domain-containing protein [Niabella yanshanensis]|uniref:PDZ domain-containing protein n=1 Tax=Niabella yanshanensis TaxID=577386 RepID=A0ABZ0W102_9BACT|nr:PDZ domain-containing protein [Niabella yanshanensis]WQD36877.1 PDZ domain-containing protein [Niabella yanshanensis]
MKKILLFTAVALPGILLAQKENAEPKEQERIIITKKGNAGEKLNIVVDGENITVNGKPVDKNDNGDITVKRLKIKDANTFSWSPEIGFDDETGDMNRQIRVFRAPNKAMLGVTTEKSDEGVKVMSVNDETGAKKAGLQKGDIITKVDDKIIEAPDQLSESLKDKKPGDKVTIYYKRDGKSATAVAELTKWNAPQVMAFNGNGANFSGPDINFDELMARIPRNDDSGSWNNRNGNFRIYGAPAFGINPSGPKLGVKIQDVEKGTGVKIIELEKGSDADKAGLKEGDVITEANGDIVEGTEDLLVQTRRSKAGSTLKLKVDRSGKSQQIDVVFSKKLKTADL